METSSSNIAMNGNATNISPPPPSLPLPTPAPASSTPPISSSIDAIPPPQHHISSTHIFPRNGEELLEFLHSLPRTGYANGMSLTFNRILKTFRAARKIELFNYPAKYSALTEFQRLTLNSCIRALNPEVDPVLWNAIIKDIEFGYGNSRKSFDSLSTSTPSSSRKHKLNDNSAIKQDSESKISRYHTAADDSVEVIPPSYSNSTEESTTKMQLDLLLLEEQRRLTSLQIKQTELALLLSVAESSYFQGLSNEAQRTIQDKILARMNEVAYSEL